MKIKILVAPLVRHPHRLRQITHCEQWLPPLGAGCLTSLLRKQGYKVHLEDLSMGVESKHNFVPLGLDNIKMHDQITDYLIHGISNKKVNHIAEKIFQCVSKDKYDLIGFSVTSRLGMASSLLLAKKIKEKTAATILFGGSLMTEYAEYKKLNKIFEILENYKFIDYIIFGEGGIPLIKLLEYLQGFVRIDEVPNLVYRNKEKTMINQRIFFNIEDMLLPDFDDLPLEMYRIHQERKGIYNGLVLPYQITRGCTQRCSFCNFYLIDHKLEMKSHQKVISELAQLKEKYKTNHFFFCESKLNLSYPYLEELCEMMVEDKLNIFWQTIVGVANIDRNLLMKMRKAGCYGLTWGIESGSDKILQVMNKGFSAAQAGNILRYSRFAGIHNTVNFISGFPNETEEDTNHTIKFIRENAKFVDRVRLFDFALAPYTPIYDCPEKFGIDNIMIDYNSHIGFGVLGFDEINGLRWKDKIKQKKRFYKRIQSQINKIFLRTRHPLIH